MSDLYFFHMEYILQIRSIWEDSLYPQIPMVVMVVYFTQTSRPKSLSISQGASPMSMTMGLAFRGRKWHDDE